MKTVNLGGNEPIFTNGIRIADTLLPYIVESLVDAGIVVGLTTSGITLLKLEQLYPHVVDLLNDIDVSLDSPNPEEHNRNRGASLYGQACKALDISYHTLNAYLRYRPMPAPLASVGTAQLVSRS